MIMMLVNITLASSNGPVVLEKLTPPETNKRQTLQKRAFIWIEGQWEIINNNYSWKTGHWIQKRVGYVFIDGEWEKKSKGWSWKEGYWKKIQLSKWYSLHS